VGRKRASRAPCLLHAQRAALSVLFLSRVQPPRGDGAGLGQIRSSYASLYVDFEYKPEVWAELVHSPENRTETVSRILDDAGCKLKGLWYAFGSSDGFALIEAPDHVTSASIAIAINASGAFRKFETTVLMTQDELLKALTKAQDVSYVAPGVAVHA
jgi:uncharacterized protein with GYD domain